ncbi:hypothetical protein BDN70DRAFT_798044 [Pholiota conissans]|uniref:Uncharacterized protein n=1 Tax=Pholiota conissans TaxID=109636 RepID=A0A9P5ZD75_9AGAR|nr:hypothetical protein BDN70DRAFT_798044 [Pholiota conissans]
MIRPPPLQLKRDILTCSSPSATDPVRTPSKPKSKSFVSQLYKASWKNPVIAVAGLNALRFAFACHNAFADAIVDDAEVAENLTKVSIALAVMYSTAFLIEIYGIIGVSMQRLGLVRAYLYLTFLASVLVTAAGVLKGVAYFTFAEEILYECISLAMEGRTAEKSLFRSRPWPSSIYGMRHGAARKQCVYAWVHQSWSQVAAVFIFSFIPSVIYYIMVYAYYRQTITPNHSANLKINNPGAHSSREVGYTRVGGGGDDSSVGLLTSARNASQSVARQRGAAAGPSRRQQTAQRSIRGVSTAATTASTFVTTSKRTFVPRSLQRPHRPPPLLQSPSPVGLAQTPPPPSYRPSRVYAAFAAPVPTDLEYDKFI